ncbi:MAG: DinB family protein [Actinomycetota bacterium]
MAAVDDALAGSSDEELDRFPPDGWSARTVVHHLADSETSSYLRLRKLLAEDDAQIQGYDEGRFAEVLHYERPIERSLEVFKAVRASSAELLDLLTPDDWTRSGTHSESGAYSVEDWLTIYADHAFAHADQIARARAALA